MVTPHALAREAEKITATDFDANIVVAVIPSL